MKSHPSVANLRENGIQLFIIYSVDNFPIASLALIPSLDSRSESPSSLDLSILATATTNSDGTSISSQLVISIEFELKLNESNKNIDRYLIIELFGQSVVVCKPKSHYHYKAYLSGDKMAANCHH